MKAKLNVNTLNKMLKAANKFVDKKSRNPLFFGRIALSVHDGIFEVLVVNPEGCEFSQHIPQEPEYNEDFELTFAPEDGAWTVDAKAFAPLKGLAKKADVVISADNNVLTVESDGFSFSMNAVKGFYDGWKTNYPSIERITSEMEVNGEDCGAFDYIRLALSTDEARPDFTGAGIRDGRVIAVDGHRLHIAPVSSALVGDFKAGVVGPAMVKAIAGGMTGRLSERTVLKPEDAKTKDAKTKDAKPEDAKPKVAAVWHVLDGDGFLLAVTAAAVGEFVDFRKVFPSPGMIAEVDAAAFADQLKLLSAGWKHSVAALRKSGDLHCVDLKRKEAERHAKLRGIDGEFADISFDTSYVIDALIGADASVKLITIDEDSPMWFGEYDGVDYGRGAVVMPMEW